MKGIKIGSLASFLPYLLNFHEFQDGVNEMDEMFLGRRLSFMGALATVLSQKEHLAMSGDILVVITREKLLWHLVVKVRDFSNIL